MSDPTAVDDPLVEVLAKLDHDDLCAISIAYGSCDDDEEHRKSARNQLAAIAETGRLLPEGGETRVEWGARYPDLHPEPVRCLDEAMARRATETEGRVLMRRTIHTGPWEAAS